MRENWDDLRFVLAVAEEGTVSAAARRLRVNHATVLRRVAAYEAATGNPWTMPLGFKHSLFEVAVDALTRTEDPTDPDSIAAAIAATNLDTVVGNINFSAGPVPNIAKTPLVGGQWQIEDGKPVLKIVENGDHPEIPLTGEMKAIG